MPPAHSLAARGLVGGGEASFGTLAPAYLADILALGRRARALGLFYLALPVGSALAYAINGRFLVPKSWVASIMLPRVLELYVGVAAEKLTALAAYLGEQVEAVAPVEGAGRAVAAVRRILGSLGLPARLRDFDLNLDDMVSKKARLEDVNEAFRAMKAGEVARTVLMFQ